MPRADEPDAEGSRRVPLARPASPADRPTVEIPRGTGGQRQAEPIQQPRERRRPAAAQPTQQLPRGTGGQRPTTRSPSPDPRRRSALTAPPATGRDALLDHFPRVPRGAREAADQAKPEIRGGHLPPYSEPDLDPTASSGPRKLTVTRIAAMRSRELTTRGVRLFHKAATADGADRSGLTHLTYAVMANYAVDAALAVALANTLFFAAASAESTGKVLLYLLITVAPFAVIAPFIGPLLDKIQNGRRVALSVTSFGRSLLAVVMAFNFNSWVLYPCALGMMVFSKSFGVLKAALTPRVLPAEITLVKTNSRLTTFGMLAGGVAGGIAAAFAGLTNASGALIWTALCGIAGGVLCLRIPAWVESTEGEVPVQHSEVLRRGRVRRFPPNVSATLWANMANRIETGFLALFIAFVVKTEYATLSGFQQLLVLGIVGAAAGIGAFAGNALGTQLALDRPEAVAAWGVVAVGVTCLIAIMIPGIAMAATVGLVGSTSSSLAKVCLDSVIQHELPEASRASAFGMSESLLQLAWVTGGVVGLLLGGVLHLKGDVVYMVGFAVVTLMVGLGVAQSWLSRNGNALIPGLAAGWEKRANRRYTQRTGAPTTSRIGTRTGTRGAVIGSAPFGDPDPPSGTGDVGQDGDDAPREESRTSRLPADRVAPGGRSVRARKAGRPRS